MKGRPRRSEFYLMVQDRKKDVESVARSRGPKALDWLKNIVLDRNEHPGVRMHALTKMRAFDQKLLTKPLLETIQRLDDSLWLLTEAKSILLEKGCVTLIHQEESSGKNIETRKAVAGKREG